MNVAIVGGSFNPIHYGHLWLAQQIYELDHIDIVWLMPNYSAHNYSKKVLVKAQDRLEMLRLAVIEFNEDLRINDIEIFNKFKYTYQTIDFLTKKQNSLKYFLVVGSDWKPSDFLNYEQIKEKCQFMVVKRQSFDQVNFVQEIEYGLSSTIIRKRIKEEKTISGLLPSSVENYIYEKGLYK